MERNSEPDNWNMLDYHAGPASIKILGYEETIEVKIKKDWLYMFNDLLSTCTLAWSLNEKDYIIIDNKIIIKLNFDITKKYIDYVITFGI